MCCFHWVASPSSPKTAGRSLPIVTVLLLGLLLSLTPVLLAGTSIPQGESPLPSYSTTDPLAHMSAGPDVDHQLSHPLYVDYAATPLTLRDNILSLFAYPWVAMVGDQREGKSSLLNAVATLAGVNDPFYVSNAGATTKGVNVASASIQLSGGEGAAVKAGPQTHGMLVDSMGTGQLAMEKMLPFLLPVLSVAPAIVWNFGDRPGNDRVQQALGWLCQCYQRFVGEHTSEQSSDSTAAYSPFGHLFLVFNKFDGDDAARAEVTTYLNSSVGQYIAAAFKHVQFVFVPRVYPPAGIARGAVLTTAMLLADSDYKKSLVELRSSLAAAINSSPQSAQTPTQRERVLRRVIKLLGENASNLMDSFQRETLMEINAAIDTATTGIRSLRSGARDGFEEPSALLASEAAGTSAMEVALAGVSERLARAVWKNAVQSIIERGVSPLAQATIDQCFSRLQKAITLLLSAEVSRLSAAQLAADNAQRAQALAFNAVARQGLDLMLSPKVFESDEGIVVVADSISIGAGASLASDYYAHVQNKALSIKARKLLVVGEVRMTQGVNIGLSAVELECGPNAAVMTDGANGAVSGQNGLSADHAGDISIAAVSMQAQDGFTPPQDRPILTLSAKGGNGATGLNGVNGADGAHGSAGANRGQPYNRGDYSQGDPGTAGLGRRSRDECWHQRQWWQCGKHRRGRSQLGSWFDCSDAGVYCGHGRLSDHRWQWREWWFGRTRRHGHPTSMAGWHIWSRQLGLGGNRGKIPRRQRCRWCTRTGRPQPSRG